ncbi:response regulator transcription factor [Sphingomonas sinipercae]|uniref:Response regulator transcription factor n=1 Tax=Sphingomonas sinipercae TaxID=2714944 RepID=A0A6G7ZKG7_9SPHN|nr:response regulator transcription factor [Sphingomonas sinipercae]QIL01471.1 response regulator transcription factor [Sphingomonas sinipercae]
MTRLVLADDHPIIQGAVRSLLEGTHYELVATASSGSAALSMIAATKPDIALLDLQMPDGSGLDVLRKLRADKANIKVVLLTASIDRHALAEALKHEVDGIVLKNSDPTLLLECLNCVGSDRQWIDPQLASIAAEATGPSLTPRERDLVALVTEGLRHREIADRLGVTEGTVKVYLHGIFEKTGVSNRTELAMRARDLLG